MVSLYPPYCRIDRVSNEKWYDVILFKYVAERSRWYYQLSELRLIYNHYTEAVHHRGYIGPWNTFRAGESPLLGNCLWIGHQFKPGTGKTTTKTWVHTTKPLSSLVSTPIGITFTGRPTVRPNQSLGRNIFHLCTVEVGRELCMAHQISTIS